MIQQPPHHDRLRTFIGSVDPIFNVAQATLALGTSRENASKTLARWCNQGHISRVRQGLYTAIPIDTPSTSFILEDPWLIIPTLFAPGYVGGFSATEYWDLTEQIFQTIMVCTTRPVPHKKTVISEQTFLLHHVQENKLFGLSPVWKGNKKVMVSDLHRTIVDIFDSPDIGGGIWHAIDCLQQYIKHPKSDMTLLTSYMDKMHNGAIYKRIGFLLEKILGPQNHVALHCKERITTGFVFLDPKQKKDVNFISQWNLCIPKFFDVESLHD